MTDKQVHCMFDLETLGPRGPIVQLSALIFDPNAATAGDLDMMLAHGDTFDVLVEPAGEPIDFDTVKWWMMQEDEARELVFDREAVRHSLGLALARFDAWAKESGITHWWSDMDFDLRILRDEWRREGPWSEAAAWGSDSGPHRGVRDYRTVKALGKAAGVELVNADDLGLIEHHALYDSYVQATNVCSILRALGVTL